MKVRLRPVVVPRPNTPPISFVSSGYVVDGCPNTESWPEAAFVGNTKETPHTTRTTSDNSPSSNRFSCVRYPKGKRARLSLPPERAGTVPLYSQNRKPSRRLCANSTDAQALELQFIELSAARKHFLC